MAPAVAPCGSLVAPAEVLHRCPWCPNVAAKDDACNWVVCGQITVNNTSTFVVGHGCGRQWCFLCGRKLCGQVYDTTTGAPRDGVRRNHTAVCCSQEEGFVQAEYCCGGHNAHARPRWADDGARACLVTPATLHAHVTESRVLSPSQVSMT